MKLRDSEAHGTCWEGKTGRMQKKMRNKGHPCSLTDAAHEKIEETIKAVELCKWELTADGYRQLRARLGHLMDTLYKIGGPLSKST